MLLHVFMAKIFLFLQNQLQKHSFSIAIKFALYTFFMYVLCFSQKVYAQTDSTNVTEEDSVVYISEEPIVIKKEVKVIQYKPPRTSSFGIAFHVAPSLFNYTYTNNSQNDYATLLNNSLYGNFSLRFGGELFYRQKNYQIGLEYDNGQMNQKISYNITDTIRHLCYYHLEHSNFALKLGYKLKLYKKITITPTLAFGISTLAKTGGKLPSTEADLLPTEANKIFVSKEFSSFLQLESKINLFLSKQLFLSISPYFNQTAKNLLKENQIVAIQRNIFGIRTGLGFIF